MKSLEKLSSENNITSAYNLWGVYVADATHWEKVKKVGQKEKKRQVSLIEP